MGKPVRNDPKRSIRAPRGTELSCKSWLTEAPMRMLMNNLDPEVAENRKTSSSTEGLDVRPATGTVMTGSSKPSSAWRTTSRS